MLLLKTKEKLHLDLPGVSQTAEGIEFSDQYSEKDIRNIVEKIGMDSLSVTSTLIRRKEYKPTESELSKLSESVKSLKNVRFYEAVAIQSYIDHHKDLLTQGFQELLAQKYNEGRTFLFGHNSSYGIGRVFGAEVKAIESDPGEWETSVKFYVSHKAVLPSQMTAVAAIEQGVYERVSIGFKTDLYKYIPESESAKGTGYWLFDVPPGADTSKTEAFELSLVGFGAQPGAAIKAAQNAPIEKMGNITKKKSTNHKSGMSLKTYSIKGIGQIEASEDSKAAMDKLVKEHTEAFEKLDQLTEQAKAFEGVDIDSLKQKAADWDKYVGGAKDQEVEKLLTLKKQVLGEDKVNAEAETKTLKTLPLEALKSMTEQYKTIAEAQAKPIKPANKQDKKTGVGSF